MKFEVLSQDECIRLDLFLSQKLDISRSHLKNKLKNIYINGSEGKLSSKLSLGDLIEADLEIEETFDILPEEMNFDVIFENEEVLVINKKSGIVVHPGSGINNNTVYNGLLYRFWEKREELLSFRMGIVHRLDKETSGCLVIAKTSKSAENLINQFKSHSIYKEYLALSHGSFDGIEKEIETNIARNPNNRKKFKVFPLNSGCGKYAFSHIYVVNKNQKYTFFRVIIATGRTHQIRVHLSSIGYPIIGDMLYGKNKKEEDVLGLALCSHIIEFNLLNGERIRVEAPPNETFLKQIKMIGLNYGQ